MKRIRVLVLLVAMVGCESAPAGLEPPAPLRSILDAVHGGGNEHFFWLPPMVGAPAAFNGPFNGAQSPVVRIEDLCEGPGCPTLIAEFTVGPDSDDVRVMPEDELYIVNWDTGDFDVGPGATYRIVVEALGQVLGHADIEFGATGTQAKNLTTNEVIGLVDGRTLPIKFRIEGGAATEAHTVPVDEPSTIEALSGEVSIDVPANALAEETQITVEPVDPVGGATVVVEFGPSGLVFEQPIQVALAYDESQLGGVAEEDLALNIFEDGEWIIIPGSVVDPATNRVSAPFFHFSKGGVGPAAKAVFCSGDGNPNTFESLQAAVDAVMAGGTVDICDGTHVVEGVDVNKPVTVQAKGGAAPLLQTSVARATFDVDGIASGTVVIDGLTFEFSTPSPAPDSSVTYAVWANNTYDQLVVLNSVFDIQPGARGSIVALASSVAGAALMVDNVTVNGGVFGIAMQNIHAEVTNSQFANTSFMGVQYASTGSPTNGLVQGSSFDACGAYCVRGWGTDAMTILGNSFGQCGRARCIGTTAGAHVNIEANTFVQQILTGDPVPDPNNQVFIAGSVTATVVGNTFNGCAFFNCVEVAGTATVTDNDFHHVTGQPEHEFSHVIGAFRSVNAVFDGNRIHSCGVFCYNVGAGANVTIRNENVTAAPGHGTNTIVTMQIFDDPGAPINTVTFEDNTITGSGAEGGLTVWDTELAINRNTFSQMTDGILIAQGITHVSTVTGRDNVYGLGGTAVIVEAGTSVDFRFNDFTGQAIDLDHYEPTADLSCNWWGNANGPQVVSGVAPATVFTPIAMAAIANTGALGCGP